MVCNVERFVGKVGIGKSEELCERVIEGDIFFVDGLSGGLWTWCWGRVRWMVDD